MYPRWLHSFTLVVVMATALVTSSEVTKYEKSNENSNVSLHGNETGHSGRVHSIHVVSLHIEPIKEPLIFTIVVLLAGFSKIVFHHANFLSSKVPESCMLIIVGTILGAIFHVSGASDNLPQFFEPHQFFMFLLPPIILESSFSLHDRTFAENLGSVLLFAVLGTIMACFMLGGTLYGLAQCGAMGSITNITFVQMLVFTSLIVAVDPVAVLAVFQEIGVNHVLYFLVFGESLLNDGVTVVLYKVMQAYNLMDEISIEQIFLGVLKFLVVCVGGLLLGVICGLISAWLTRFSVKVKVVQPVIIYGMAYMGFMLAELFEFSGIISIIGCGLVQVQYAFHNISDKSKTTIKYFTKVISSFSEIIIFLFLGLSFVRQSHVWHTGFILWTVLLCLVYRFIITFTMAFFINKFDINRVRKIGFDEQFMIAYGGLRGAVCFSLVALLDENEIPMKNLFETATLAVIVFTGFVQGISIKPLVKLLQIRLAPTKNVSMYCELNEHITDHMMAGIEDVIGFHGRYYLKEQVEHLDDTYFKPCLLQRPMKRSDSSIRGFYEKIMLKEHLKYLELCGAKSVPANIPKVSTQLYCGDSDEDSESESSSGSDNDMPLTSSNSLRPKSGMSGQPRLSGARSRFSSTGSSQGIVMRNKEKDLNVQDLRSLLQSMHSSRYMLHPLYDKNLTLNDRISRSGLLKDKTRRNRNLKRVMTTSGAPELLRTTSWDDDQSEACDKRAQETQASKSTPRSVSVDLSKVATPRVHFQPASGMTTLSEVPNVKEEEEDGSPLLRKSESCDSERNKLHHMERQDAVDEIPMVVVQK